jgi:hypothetical protein
MKKYLIIVLAIAAATLALSACSSGAKRALGLKKHTPDEFMVISRPPLAVPPDFGLPPPDEAAVRSQSQVRDEAKKVLFSDETGTKASSSSASDKGRLSKGEKGLLGAAGTEQKNENIRSILNAETQAEQIQVEDKSLLDKVIDPLTPAKKDPMVDIDKEEDRLTKNKEEGKSPAEGDVPIAEKKNKGVINELLGF